MSRALATFDRADLPDRVVAAGKGAAGMFRAAADALTVRAAVVTAAAERNDGDAPGVERFAAGHPSPNAASVEAARRALALAAESASGRGLLVLLSGGASAMLAAPVDEVPLAAKIETGRALMAAGAAIDELNCVRKHLSQIKGGRLAASAGRCVTLALSDVHGPIPDDPSVIGSGITVADPTTFADAIDVLRRRGVTPPPPVDAYLERGAHGEVPETVKPGDPRLARSDYRIVGSRSTAAEGARVAAGRLGYHVVVLEDASSGEARDAGAAFVGRAQRLASGRAEPVCVIATGETTVTVRGKGLGGRNQEFALGGALLVSSLEGGVLASAGTDGIDGPTDAAGAIVDTSTLERAAGIGLDPSIALAGNDAYRFFDALGDLLRWGPTGTNVGDLHVALFGTVTGGRRKENRLDRLDPYLP